ncbi:MAG: hypothetical protein L6Q66_03470 [Bacteroidia bacterium]|nr:hypothetical protein [Bacteroidia bacterium]
MTDKKNKTQKQKSLSGQKIRVGTNKGLKKYKNLNFLERYALFMGVSQILEINLKNLLVDKYEYDINKIEKWTMGKTCSELEQNKLRPDFILLLKSVVDYRNYIAHELLANKFLMHSLLEDKIPENHYDKESRRLDKAIIELEQLFFLFTWTDENNGWT